MSRPGAQDRLGRLLAIVPWVAARDGPALDEVCRRFGVTERDLLDDLDLLFLCGVYPFTPDVLIEVDVADGRVWIRFAEYFHRPLRLTPPEGLALISAGSALLGVPGADTDGALARAVEKLASALGVAAHDAVAVQLGPATPEILELVRRAVAGHRLVELDYYSFGRDDRSTRVVEPWRVFNARGQWYLSANCRLAGGERLFRLDRMSRATILDDTFEPPAAMPDSRLFHRGPHDQTVVLDLAPAARWIAEQYPTEAVADGPAPTLRVTMRVSEPAWLERLLLRAGSAAVVVEGDPTLGPAAAARILARYRRTGTRGTQNPGKPPPTAAETSGRGRAAGSLT